MVLGSRTFLGGFEGLRKGDRRYIVRQTMWDTEQGGKLRAVRLIWGSGESEHSVLCGRYGWGMGVGWMEGIWENKSYREGRVMGEYGNSQGDGLWTLEDPVVGHCRGDP